MEKRGFYEQLIRLIGSRVSVWCGVKEDKDNPYHAQVSATGALEYNGSVDQFRIKQDRGNYAYFRADDVLSIEGAREDGHPRKDKAAAGVKIRCHSLH